jgi:hypothetical protein
MLEQPLVFFQMYQQGVSATINTKRKEEIIKEIKEEAKQEPAKVEYSSDIGLFILELADD